MRFYLILGCVLLFSSPANARDQIKIVGSSSVSPYASAVAESYSSKTGGVLPLMESEGTGSGFRQFCKSNHVDTPDIVNASRPMKSSEWELCRKNGVHNITEVHFGNDGLTIAISKKGKNLNVSVDQLYQALAKKIPIEGKLVANPHRKWSDIDPTLPDNPIQVYGPGPRHGTYDTFTRIVLRKTCEKMSFFRAKAVQIGDRKKYKKYLKDNCSELRLDGYVGTDQKDEEVVKLLEASPVLLGVFGYTVLFKNRDTLKAVQINGVEPRIYTISDGSYVMSRPLFFYVKNTHRKLVSGLDEYIHEFMNEEAMGSFGYLLGLGLGVLPVDELRNNQYAAVSGARMRRYTE